MPTFAPLREGLTFLSPPSESRADAIVCIRASQIWGPDVEEAQPLDPQPP